MAREAVDVAHEASEQRESEQRESEQWKGVGLHRAHTGNVVPMSDAPDTGRLSDDDMTSGPTEAEQDRDRGGHGSRDTGDEPTEERDDRDRGGEGSRDTGDESSAG